MSSINSSNNTPDLSAFNTPTPSTMTEQEKKLLAQAKLQEGTGDVTQLLGLTPGMVSDIANGKTQQANKFTQVGAARYLEPPSAPKVQVTQRQIDAYNSLAGDVNQAFGQFGQMAQGIIVMPGNAKQGMQGGVQGSPGQGKGEHAKGQQGAQQTTGHGQKTAHMHQATRAAVNPGAQGMPEGVQGQGTDGVQGQYQQYAQGQGQGTQGTQGQGTSSSQSFGGAGATLQVGTADVAATKDQAQAVAQKALTAMGALGSSGMMTAFLMLQVGSQSQGLDARNAISNLSSKLRQSDMETEKLHDKEAQQAMDKALAKAQKMGVLSKVLTVLTVILTAVMAIATFGAGAGLALVAAAMVIGALAGGLKEGNKDGKQGFDLMGALNGAAIGGDVVMAAFGVTEIIAALELSAEAALKASGEAATQATKQGGATGAKQAAETAGNTASQTMVKNIQDSLSDALKKIGDKKMFKKIQEILNEVMSSQAGKKVGEAGQAVSKGIGKAGDATNNAFSQIGSKVADSGVGQFTKNSTEAVGNFASKTGSQISSAASDVAEATGMKAAAKSISETSARLGKDVSDSAVGQAVKTGAGKVSDAASTVRGYGPVQTVAKNARDLGNGMVDIDTVASPLAMKSINVGSIVLDSGGKIGKEVGNYKENTYNLDAKEAQQLSAQDKNQADSWQNLYEDVQTYIQGAQDSHNKSVSDALQMMQQHFQSNMRVDQNIGG